MSIKTQNIVSNKKNSGFVILYAVIITTVVLIVGVSLMNIITKQLVLSSISRNAKISYYAALSGRECAEFWKTVQMANFNNPTYFGGGTLDEGWADPDEGGSMITCFNNGNEDVPSGKTSVIIIDDGISVTNFNFDFVLNGNQNTCANVTVYADNTKPCQEDKLLITSEGYNTTCADALGKNPQTRIVKSIYRDKESCPPVTN